jgi:hypothetical protein
MVDLRQPFSRQFSLVDGIVGMEGNRPIQGAPKTAGVLAAGSDPAKAGNLPARQNREGVASVATPLALIPYFRSYRIENS